MTKWGVPWDHSNYAYHQTDLELRHRGLVKDLPKLSQATSFPAWTGVRFQGPLQQPSPCKP